MRLPRWFSGKESACDTGDVEMWIRFLVREDPLEEEMATCSSILVWGIPWPEEPGSYNPWGHKESDKTDQISLHLNL